MVAVARLLLAALCVAALPRLAVAALVYVTDDGSTPGAVSIVDPVAGTVVGTVPIADVPKGIVFAPDGTRAYVTSVGNAAAVNVIDTATRTVTGTIAIGAPDCEPEVAVDP